MMHKGRAVLGGFEYSEFLDDQPVISMVGAVARMAPEMIEGQLQGREIDVWQTGLLLFELATGDPAFAGATGE